MSRTDKILAKWKTRPTIVEKEEVFCVLRRYGFSIESKRGSHNIIRHEQLAGMPNFGLNGEFCLPVHNGRKIKGYHLKRVIEAVECVATLMPPRSAYAETDDLRIFLNMSYAVDAEESQALF